MSIPTPNGVTPPAPGLDHEEPEMMVAEADIPQSGDGWRWATAEMDQLGRQ